MPFRRVQHLLHFDYVKDLWFIEQAQYEIDTYGTDESGNLKLRSFKNMKEKDIQKFERNVSLKCLRNRWLYLKKKYKNWVTLKQLLGSVIMKYGKCTTLHPVDRACSTTDDMNVKDTQVPLAGVNYLWEGEVIPSYGVPISPGMEPTPGSTSRTPVS
ncbi:hypothetical protein GIB67_022898 [Kingdonia uniflora]|uniref:Uncharacterized protein n=1 Tax=Kingdonia uniflora TaxID=39325 RepID=A0A7J7PD09_9MAGN|nr:hypothetical protein GIB67_022898 [Kingdonia uniflora]